MPDQPGFDSDGPDLDGQDSDSQDRAEIWDEDNQDTDEHRVLSADEELDFDLRPDVLDATRRVGDEDDDDALIGDDLDDLTALCKALDVVIGPATATTNLAAAGGGALWLISTPGAWPRLGTDRYPWYPQARVFTPAVHNDWAPLMDEVASALGQAITTHDFSGTR